jgi:hypothetical protein
MKDLKEIIDRAEQTFYFLNKKQISILQSYLKVAYSQGKLDLIAEEREEAKKN